MENGTFVGDHFTEIVKADPANDHGIRGDLRVDQQLRLRHVTHEFTSIAESSSLAGRFMLVILKARPLLRLFHRTLQ